MAKPAVTVAWDLSQDVDRLWEMTKALHALEADVKRARDALLDAMLQQDLERTEPTASGHVASVVASETTRIDMAKAQELLHPNTLRAISTKTAVVYVKVR